VVAGPGIMLEVSWKFHSNLGRQKVFQNFTFFKNTCYGPNLSPIYGPLGRLEMTEPGVMIGEAVPYPALSYVKRAIQLLIYIFFSF
jgi:hypothetical protein